jgi:hypothetical protein
MRIFGPMRDITVGDWRKVHNEELHNAYSTPNIIRMLKSRTTKLARQAPRMRISEEPEQKRLLRRQRGECEDNTKMDLKEIGWGGMDWINVAQAKDQWRALVNMVISHRVR